MDKATRRNNTRSWIKPASLATGMAVLTLLTVAFTSLGQVGDIYGQPDSDGDGVPDSVEESLGTDPNDPDSIPLYDLTETLTMTRTQDGVDLSWSAPDSEEVLGFQVWRRASPWVLVAELPPATTSFLDEDPPEGSVYKVTFYTGTTLAQGYVSFTEEPNQIPGWNEDSVAESTEGGESVLDGIPHWAKITLLVLVNLIVVVVVMILVVARKKK